MIRAILLLASVSVAFGAAIGAPKGGDGQKDGQFAQIQEQLDKLQSDLQLVQRGFSAVNRRPLKLNNVADDVESADRLPLPQRRGVGWQPLKRSGMENPSFQLGFNDPANLRQQMVEAIEDHLLQDLETARQYGIEPQQILQDLRAKHQRE